jgi:hypothetical protein
MTELTNAHLVLLRQLAGRIIPASAEYGVPGADDEAIFQEIVDALQPNMAPVRDMLAGLEPGHVGEPPADTDALIQRLGASHEMAFAALIAAVAQCYYRDDRVMRSLGMEIRPPFPKGFEVDEGDWSLLDPVRARPRFWRDAP